MNGSSEDAKSSVIIIFCKGSFNIIDPVGYLDGLAKIGRFLSCNGGKDFIMADSRL